MVKQTQKTMIFAAAIILLLLAFGLGFYTYPLVESLDKNDAEQGAATANEHANDGVNSSPAAVESQTVSPNDASQTASNQTLVNAGQEASALLQGEVLDPATPDDQGGGVEASLANVDLSGIEKEDLEVFLDAWRALERDFFGERPDSRHQVYGAIRGMLQSYDDPYTFFIEPETNEVEQGNLRGSFGGIGAHVRLSEFGFVLDPIRDNPAQKAGVESGDLLVQIDDVEVNVDTPVDDVIAMIRGPLDTDVALQLLRADDPESMTEESLNDAESLTVTITRAEIRTPSVDWRIITDEEIPVERILDALRTGNASDGESVGAAPDDLENADAEHDGSDTDNEDAHGEGADPASNLPEGVTEQDVESWQNARIGYIQHRIYSDRSPQEMREAIGELLDDGADRFIIDLRGNPGGPVTSVVQVTDLWIEEPLIMSEEKADGAQRIFEAADETLVDDQPVVIVVDGGTASASEIFAGALRDHNRAVILGEKTFGKGSVQVIHVLPDLSSMHITNARWFTPDGHKIDGTGLMPDIQVEPGTDALQEAILHILEVEEAR